MKYPDEFETTEELRDYVIQAILNTGLVNSLKETNPDVYTFFVSLFQRHPEKDRKEIPLITDISIRIFPKSKNKKQLEFSDYQFLIIKSNGTEDTISWNSCVINAVNPFDKRINWAMRHAIEEQIKEFKTINKNKPCEFCETYSEPTADHIIKFKKLKDDFLEENPEHPTELGKNEFAQEVFREEDAEFVKLWQEYHKKNATLRILCKNCNQKLDNYGVNYLEKEINLLVINNNDSISKK